MTGQLRQVNAISLEAIYTSNIASEVPIHGEKTIVELAKQCKMNEPDLRRILRFAIIDHRVFQEPWKGIITHSAASRRLVEDSATRDGLGLRFDDGWQSFARVCFHVILVEIQCLITTIDCQSYAEMDRPRTKQNCRSHSTVSMLLEKPLFGASRPAKVLS